MRSALRTLNEFHTPTIERQYLCRTPLWFMGSWPITSQIIWTADEIETTPGERQGVSPPCKYRCDINAHFQNTHHAVPDRGTR
jgi:hypothetical protein